MNQQTLIQIVAALSVAHSLHALIEFGNVRAKLRRLGLAIAQKPLPKYPVNINTRVKAYGIGLVILAIFFLLAYFIISILALSLESCAWVAIISLLVIELINLVGFDRYHINIERLIKQFSK